MTYQITSKFFKKSSDGLYESILEYERNESCDSFDSVKLILKKFLENIRTFYDDECLDNYNYFDINVYREHKILIEFTYSFSDYNRDQLFDALDLK